MTLQVETEADIAAVVRLAGAIWREHYVSIVGQAQVDYMLGKFQSAAAIRDQLDHGFELTVNRHNTTSIAWYETKGFVNVRPLVQDIGNGFVMDDFVMEKAVI